MWANGQDSENQISILTAAHFIAHWQVSFLGTETYIFVPIKPNLYHDYPTCPQNIKCFHRLLTFKRQTYLCAHAHLNAGGGETTQKKHRQTNALVRWQIM